MATLIWNGEPDPLNAEGNVEGPMFNTWNGVRFQRGEPVEVNNERMIAKARRNPFYSVDGKTFDPKAETPDEHRVPVAPKRKAGPVIQDKTQLSEMTVAELREEADRRGIDHEGMTKAELRERLAENSGAHQAA